MYDIDKYGNDSNECTKLLHKLNFYRSYSSAFTQHYGNSINSQLLQQHNDETDIDSDNIRKQKSETTAVRIPGSIWLLSINNNGECCGIDKSSAKISIWNFYNPELYLNPKFKYVCVKINSDNTFEITTLKVDCHDLPEINNRSEIIGPIKSEIEKGLQSGWWDKKDKLHTSNRDNFKILRVTEDAIFGICFGKNGDQLPTVDKKQSSGKYINEQLPFSLKGLQKLTICKFNEEGNIFVGTHEDQNTVQAFACRNSHYMSLKSLLNNTFNRVTNINNDGSIIIGQSGSQAVKWVWNSKTEEYDLHELIVPNSSVLKHSLATYVSDDGQLIAGLYYTFSTKVPCAMIWRDNKLQGETFVIPSLTNRKIAEIIYMSSNGNHMIVDTDNNEQYVVYDRCYDKSNVTTFDKTNPR